MALSQDSFRVLSRPIPVLWCGFRSTTTELQQCGWQLAVEQDFHRDSMRLLMRHRDLNLYAYSESLRYQFLSRNQFSPDEGHIFTVTHCASRFETMRCDVDFSRFREIDAFPQVTTKSIQSIEDLGIFAVPLARTEEIIVDPKTVDELLDQIRKMQEPGQASIRKRQRQGEPAQRQQFHAQILSIAA